MGNGQTTIYSLYQVAVAVIALVHFHDDVSILKEVGCTCSAASKWFRFFWNVIETFSPSKMVTQIELDIMSTYCGDVNVILCT